jgi:hypothetical protein
MNNYFTFSFPDGMAALCLAARSIATGKRFPPPSPQKVQHQYTTVVVLRIPVFQGLDLPNHFAF